MFNLDYFTPLELVGPLGLTKINRSVSREQATVVLEPKQFTFLAYLASKPDTVVTKDELYREIWTPVRPQYKIIDVMVCHIRKRLAVLGDGSERSLVTIPSVGYALLSDFGEYEAMMRRWHGNPASLLGRQEMHRRMLDLERES